MALLYFYTLCKIGVGNMCLPWVFLQNHTKESDIQYLLKLQAQAVHSDEGLLISGSADILL
jgi:hypothetical protein